MNNAQWEALLGAYGVKLQPGADPAERWKQALREFKPAEMNQLIAENTQELLDLLQTPPRSAKPGAPPAPAGRPQASGTADLSLQVNSIGVDALQRFSTADWKALLNSCGAKVPLGVDPAARWTQLAQLRHGDPRRFASVMVNAQTLQRVLTQPAAREQLPRLDMADRRQWAALLAEQGHRLPPGADPAAAWKRIREKFNDQEVMRVLDRHPQALLRILLAENGASGEQKPERPQGAERPKVPPRAERTNSVPPAPGKPPLKSLAGMGADQVRQALMARGMSNDQRDALRKEIMAQRQQLNYNSDDLRALGEKYSGFLHPDDFQSEAAATILRALLKPW